LYYAGIEHTRINNDANLMIKLDMLCLYYMVQTQERA